MYSTRQILKGIRNPKLFKNELKFKLNSYKNLDYAVTGAYWTGNIGDRAIAISIRNNLLANDKSVELLPTRIGKTNSNVHVIGGGGVLRDCSEAMNEEEPEILNRSLDWVSKKNRGAIIGVGVPGFKTNKGKQIAKNKLPNVELITVRDEWSLEKIKEYCDNKVHVTACPAFLLDPPNTSPSNYTGVNFRTWPNYNSDIMEYHFDYDDINMEEAKKKYIRNAQNICNNVDNPVFIPFTSGDEQFAKNNLDIKILPYEFSVEKTLKRVSRADKMVTMRYHSLIFSALTDTPVLPLAYQPKVSYLADRLNIRAYKPNKENIPIKFEYPSGVNKIKEEANKNFKLLENI